MAPIDLNLLRTFTTVYRAGSFTGAARKLGVPRSTVSRAIAALEERVGAQLVHRTTRTMSITAEGTQLFDRIAPSLGGLEAALDELPVRADEPTGVVRVTSMPDLGASVLAEAAVRFTARFPRAQVELQLTPDVLDIARGTTDIALRVVRNRLPDSALIARKVGTLAFQLYASPTYLARRGAPRAPAELAQHDWIGFRGVTAESFGMAAPKGGLGVGGRIACDDMFVIRELVRRGGGVAAIPSFFAAEDLQAGTLVRVLPKLALATSQVYVIHLARRLLPARVTAFRDLVIELLRQRPLTVE